MVLYSKFTYGSQFSEEKNGLEIRFLVPEIVSKYKRSIFFETPCMKVKNITRKMQQDKCNVNNAMEQIKWEDEMWQILWDKFNITNAMCQM